MKSVAFQTLGCKINQTETAALQTLFEQSGYTAVPFNAHADVYIINTCTVTHIGDRKSRQAIRRARRSNPEAVIVVTGCYAQVAPEEVLALPEVDLVVGTHAREKLPQLVKEAKKGRLNCVAPLEDKGCFESLPPAQSIERTRAFLKIQEGCRQFCSYCIVPYARGPLYSRSVGAVVKEVQRLAGNGFRELVLTGVHLGSYGVDLPERPDLSELISAIVPVAGIERIRLSSIEPTEITSALVDVIIENSKVCRHLHIPLQSGDDYILKRMNRKYDAGEFLHLAQWLQAKVPGIALTTDVMVGFPGESEAHFARTVEVVKRCCFSRLHVFKYSPRRGTPAAKFQGQVPSGIKEERSRLLIETGSQLAALFRSRFIGETVQVLFEEKTGRGRLAGLTEHYIRVIAKAPTALSGSLADVRISGEEQDSLYGELLK
ncbi:MAG: tRNA (N(6)-L-threonylcarbamoyladenosine(37)-C(2))-methylthiotransferase MtaB [Dethiobacter sp.]|jgi:threonylcarbamoyladenosine tRNA methylthiotransferase MtaB|nr:tRNA (N(6)-L-threonylcarbamoyladenosine(37)-C(2))-methylthiotransferase MtaB [Dethiobacter sp.]